MSIEFTISIVIPTYNRKLSLLRLLSSLKLSDYPIHETIIVDSGDDRLTTEELRPFNALQIQYLHSDRSVCIQRNAGIKKANGHWIFLCDDDLEVPSDYLRQLTTHIKFNAFTGAVSGRVLQKENNEWTDQYPIVSSARLLWNFIFQLGVWGEIKITSNNVLLSRIKHYYKTKGNHISKAGWPVLTNFSGEYFKTPVYGLGASLIRKDWLLNSLYDEVLDANGIGDNYGVAVGFPAEGIHVLNTAFVYHHRELSNRPPNAARYWRRILALHYFLSSKPELKHLRLRWFVWSLFGTLMENILSGQKGKVSATLKSLMTILLQRNPYLLLTKKKRNASTFFGL